MPYLDMSADTLRVNELPSHATNFTLSAQMLSLSIRKLASDNIKVQTLSQ